MKKIKEAKLSAKGQITVPKEIRNLLAVENGDSIAFYIDENEIRLTKPENLYIKAKDKNKLTTIQKEGKQYGQK